MLGLIIKDFLYLKNILKNIVIMFIASIVISILLDNYFLAISLVPVMLISTGMNVFQTDEFYNTEIYTLTYPLSRRKIVKARYLYTWLIFLIAIVLELILFLCFSLIVSSDSLDLSLLLMSLFLSVITIIFDFIFYPLIYKYGCEKSSFVLVTIVLVLMVAFAFIKNLLDYFGININVSYLLSLFTSYGAYFCLIGTAVIFLLSYFISCKVYEKLDF